MSEQTEKKRKKYLLIGLCSVLLLGSAGTYAAYNKVNNQLRKQTDHGKSK